MFPQKYKLLLRRQVDFFTHSQRYYTHFFIVFYQPSKCKSGQLVVIVPKKIIKLRVRRNFLKRRIYHASLPLIKLGLKSDLALVIKEEIKAASWADITHDLKKIFNFFKQND